MVIQLANLKGQNSSLVKIESNLQNSYLRLLSFRFNNTQLDSIWTENLSFRNKLEFYTSNFPSSLTHPFDSLQGENIYIASSKDKMFRIYSWDTWQGGTMHIFENVIQYKSEGKVYSQTFYDSSEYGDNYIPFYSQIFTLNTEGKTYYLAIANGVYSTKYVSQSLKIFTIENGSLNDSVKLIKSEKTLVNSIDLHFDFFSVVDRAERPLRLIKYDEKLKLFSVPIVRDEEIVTDKYELYKFTGQYFERVVN